jgi:hypothetical protein
MAENSSNPRPERPRVEPEIIPPGEPLRTPRTGEFTDRPFGPRIYVARFGTFGIIMVVLGVLAIATVILVLLLGALLIWIPVVGLIVAAAVLSRFLRSRARRGP